MFQFAKQSPETGMIGLVTDNSDEYYGNLCMSMCPYLGAPDERFTNDWVLFSRYYDHYES